MSYNTPKPLSEILQNYIDKFPHKTKLRKGMVLSIWEDVVGTRIAEQTENLHFEGSRLVMTVKNQVWRHEIHANRFNIAKKLNKRVKSQIVSDIIVRA